MDTIQDVLGKASAASLDDLQAVLLGLNGARVAGYAVPVLTIAHGLNVLLQTRIAGNAARQAVLQSLVAFIICSTGGSALTSVLLGTRINSFSMASFPYLFGCWCLLYLNPWLHSLLTRAVFRVPIATVAAISQATNVFAGVELATQLARGEFILAFVCGVLSATGGGILGDAFQLYNTNWGLRTPSAFSELSSRIVLPMIASNLYTLSTLPDVPRLTGLPIKLSVIFILAVPVFFNTLGQRPPATKEKPKRE
ncbi:TRIC channel [Plasmodiophora brassicae]